MFIQPQYLPGIINKAVSLWSLDGRKQKTIYLFEKEKDLVFTVLSDGVLVISLLRSSICEDHLLKILPEQKTVEYINFSHPVNLDRELTILLNTKLKELTEA